MRRNAADDMVLATWISLADKYPTATFDAFVVMPNHVHGIVTLLSHDFVGETPRGLPRDGGLPSLSTIVGWFKTMTTNWYMQGVRQHGSLPFDGQLSQRSFHDHIIRDDADMERIRTYITYNPALWNEDTFFEEGMPGLTSDH